MEELALRVRTFVYTMICFQCLIQLSVGNAFYKYLKLFSQLLAICICCNIFFSFLGIVDDGWEQADEIYEQWQKQWSNEEMFVDMNGYLENHIMDATASEFEAQIEELLKIEGEDRYVLREVTQKGDKWEIILEEKQQQERNDFVLEFKEAVCREFSLQEDQLEVKLR